MFTSTLLIVTAYLTDILSKEAMFISLGESTSVASAIYSLGSLVGKLTLPLISIGIAASKGGINALPAGFIGGVLVTSGATAQNISGSISGVSGVLGSIAAGYLASYSEMLCSRVVSKSKNKPIYEILCPSLSILLTAFGMFTINSISAYFSSYASDLLATTGGKGSVFLPLLLGIFLTIDPAGPLLISAYIFGASSIATSEPQVMAVIVAAGMVPALSMGLFAYMYKERLEPFERAVAYAGIIPAILGISNLSYPLYVSRNYRFILPSVTGGCVTAVLTVLFRCSTQYPMGGILSFSSSGRPLFFLVAVICGVLVSAMLLSFTIKPEIKENNEKKETDIYTNPIKKPT